MIEAREQGYRKFWKRRIASTYHSSDSDTPRVKVYAFRPTWKPWAPSHSHFVYITGGMADAPMPVREAHSGFSRIELSCFAVAVTGFGNPRQDEIARWLHAFARLPFQENQPINPGEILDVGQPLAEGSEMSAFYFALTPFVDNDALCRATLHAEAVVHVVPISEAERTLVEREGAAALNDAFQRAAVTPVFNLGRQSCV